MPTLGNFDEFLGGLLVHRIYDIVGSYKLRWGVRYSFKITDVLESEGVCLVFGVWGL